MEVKIGTDIVSIKRFQSLISEKSLERLFLPSELHDRKPEHLAGIFAAKESVMKALGIPAGTWQKIEIIYEKNGRPKLNLALGLIAGKSISSSDLSISHDGEYAIASAVFLIET